MWRMLRVFVIGLLCFCIVGLGICVAQAASGAIESPVMLLIAAVPAGLAWVCYTSLRKFLRDTAPASPPEP